MRPPHAGHRRAVLNRFELIVDGIEVVHGYEDEADGTVRRAGPGGRPLRRRAAPWRGRRSTPGRVPAAQRRARHRHRTAVHRPHPGSRTSALPAVAPVLDPPPRRLRENGPPRTAVGCDARRNSDEVPLDPLQAASAPVSTATSRPGAERRSRRTWSSPAPHRLLVFPRQHLNHADLLTVALFGTWTPNVDRRYAVGGFPGITTVISNIVEDGKHVGIYDGDDEEEWHADNSLQAAADGRHAALLGHHPEAREARPVRGRHPRLHRPSRAPQAADRGAAGGPLDSSSSAHCRARPAAACRRPRPARLAERPGGRAPPRPGPPGHRQPARCCSAPW